MSAIYRGILPIYLGTYTTIFGPLNAPWTFNPNALQPMEFVGKVIVPDGTPVACGGTVFDAGPNNTGRQSKFQLGDLSTGSINNNFGNAIWRAGRLTGWVFNFSDGFTGYGMNYTMALGSHLVAPLSLTVPQTLPHLSNTQIPGSDASSNWFLADGTLYAPYVESLVQYFALWNGTGIAGNSPYTFSYGTTNGIQAILPWNGKNWIFTVDGGGGTPNKGLQESDFLTHTTVFAAGTVLENPVASTLDFNVLINAVATQNPDATYAGWLWFFKDAQTVDGVSLDGYGVLVQPDFSQWWILQINPVDAQSQNWNTGSGQVNGKFDETGALWLKDMNAAATIYRSSPATIPLILPIIPPVDIATPPPDTEIPLLAYEGY